MTHGQDASQTRRRLLAALVTGAVTLVDYLGWLGWDQRKDVHPDGHFSGPYQSWQVIGVVLVLIVLAAAAGWRRHTALAAGTITVVMTVAWAVDAVTDPINDGLWPVGAFVIGAGTLLGVALVASLTEGLAKLVHRARP